VLRFEQDGDGVTVVYRRKGREESVRGDRAICTLPCTVMDGIAAGSGFSGRKRRALRGVNYDSAVKTFAVTRRRFWEQDDGIYGGGSVTDLASGATYYPSDNAAAKDPAVSARRSVLLASYGWGGLARRQARLGAGARADAVLREVARLHPQLAEPGMVERRFSWNWDRARWSGGAYAFFRPGQQSALYADLLAPEGRVHFAGEHCSLDHSWMQGAMESALRTVKAIAG
jgi:monoamine oxidase